MLFRVLNSCVMANYAVRLFQDEETERKKQQQWIAATEDGLTVKLRAYCRLICTRGTSLIIRE